MTGPYRAPSGTSCPRCHSILNATRDNGLVCANGCGEWMTNAAVVYLVGTSEFVRLGKPGLHHRATPLPATKCVVCSAMLDDQYPAITIDDVLTIGRCSAHGVWIEGRDRAAFEAAYRVAIARHRQSESTDSRTPEPTPTLEERVARLEARIAQLEAVLLER